ncbi:MICOS complex subunit MIC60-like isoform X2 [Biomphalaria glabrata]|uniref:MICOS complex subunit MIC60 n=1 Tax=Biomphalaria glabrata TaxID=6526 RepID=A0A9W3A1F8_BIOGL|nr:MICOS complex subunit MIC60-like isoform X2 [Biomphalaria glabrata]
MWRTRTTSQTRQIVSAAKRHLATESTPPVKSTVPPPIPPQSQPPKTSGFRLFKFLGFGLPIAATSLLGYVWYDPNFRKQLEANIPYAKELLGNILPEEKEEKTKDRDKTPDFPMVLEKATKLNVQENQVQVSQSETKMGLFEVSCTAQCISSKSESFMNDSDSFQRTNSNTNSDLYASYIAPSVDRKHAEYSQTKPAVQTQSCHAFQLQPLNKPESETVEAPSIKETPVTLPEEKKSKIDPRVVDAQIKKKEDDEKADNAALEVVIHKLMTNSQNLTEMAVQAQRDLASSISNHTKLLKQAMDDSSDILGKDAQWEAVSIAHTEKEQAMIKANDLAVESKKSIEKLREVLAESKKNQVTKQNPAILPASKKVSSLLRELSDATTQVRQAEAESNVMQKYKDLVEKGKKQFQKELESLLPDVKIGSGKKLTEDELNALIAHAHRRIEQLQKQIAEQLAMERQRLSLALEAQRQEDLKITKAAVAEEHLRLQEEFDVEKQKMEMEYLMKIESEVRKQLARQAAAHSDHLKDVLSVQQQQLNKEFSRELQTKLLEQREKFQSEVVAWIGRLKGIEAALEARADSEKLARFAQNLWLACISLNSAIQFGDDNNSETVPLRKRIEAILNSSNKHPFVMTVANTIPVQALDTGISTEEKLRLRFFRVSKICRRLGLIREPNTSLYKYLISYLHSMFVFDNIVATSENDVIDLSSMDNYALLAHAQYWMERGNLNIALRFMCQLTGEPRRAASDWINEARLLLETRQSAHALTAYASATGLAHTF